MADHLTELLLAPAELVAPRLLGCLLVSEIGGRRVAGRIVETEAYDQTDAASHSYRGETQRTRVMFGPAGHLYVYFTYGMHYCRNVVTGPVGHGAAVFIRALEPLENDDGHSEEIMAERRGGRSELELTNGPAKLCQALGITGAMNGHDLNVSPVQLIIQPALALSAITQTTRVGISKAKDMPWRFYVGGSRYVSK